MQSQSRLLCLLHATRITLLASCRPYTNCHFLNSLIEQEPPPQSKGASSNLRILNMSCRLQSYILHLNIFFFSFDHDSGAMYTRSFSFPGALLGGCAEPLLIPNTKGSIQNFQLKPNNDCVYVEQIIVDEVWNLVHPTDE